MNEPINYDETIIVCYAQEENKQFRGFAAYVDDQKNWFPSQLQNLEEKEIVAECYAVIAALELLPSKNLDGTIYISREIYSLLNGVFADEDFSDLVNKIIKLELSYFRERLTIYAGEHHYTKTKRVKFRIRPDNDKNINWSLLNND